MGNKNILGCIESNDNKKEEEEYNSVKTNPDQILNKITEEDYPKESFITKKSDTTLRRGAAISTSKHLPQIKPNSIIPVSIDKAILVGEGNNNIYDKYEISDNEKDKLGEGTFGTVIKAKHKLTGII